VLEVLRRVFVRQMVLVEEDEEVRAVVELALFKMELSPELESGRQQQIRSGKQLIAQIADAVQQGIERGELRADLDAADIARAFLAFQNGAIQLWLVAPEAFSLKASAEAFAGIFIAGVRAAK